MNTDKKIAIAIGKDWAGWHMKFARSLEQYQSQGIDISYSIVDLDSNEWQKNIAPYEVIVWNPHYMGIRLASHLKEKIYFMQMILNKQVFPGFNTVWHFESKVAESSLFQHYQIKTPRTFVSFNYGEACHELESTRLPVVLKKSEGASSQNVKLISDKKRMYKILENTFTDQLWAQARSGTSKIGFGLKNFTRRWFWLWLFQRVNPKLGGEGVIYWQEFIAGNRADLRITVIGDRFAYGFWRNNRPNDFRASGSGLIDYHRPFPSEVMEYCININKALNFDSMCYDILFTQDSFVINEMSYSYIDKALYNAPGYYEVSWDGALTFQDLHTWPEELWIKWILLKTGYLEAVKDPSS